MAGQDLLLCADHFEALSLSPSDNPLGNMSMARFNPHETGVEAVYQAAARWRQTCLLANGSVFLDDRNIWTQELLNELDERFVQNLDEGAGNFFEKLHEQLTGGSPQCKQLMAEIDWLLLLFASRISKRKKRQDVRLIWSWSGETLTEDHPLLSDATLVGIGHTGTAYNTHRWREFVFIINALRDFKSRTTDEQAQLASSPWDFARWLVSVPGGKSRQLRHILPHLIFPDDFERISTVRDKYAILSAFDGVPEKELRKLELDEIDQSLQKLRRRLEAEQGKPIDFYSDGLVQRWRTSNSASMPKNQSVPPEADDSLADDDEDGCQSEAVPVTPYGLDEALRELFLDRGDVARYLTIWRNKKNLILQGAPGVGKSFIARRLAYALIGFRDDSKVQTVQFHQSYSYEDFVQGYRPNGNHGFERKDGTFHTFCARARRDPNGTYVFIIDEINRGNLSKIFGELMLLIEADKRSETWKTRLAYARDQEEDFFVPDNLFILGMMNTADRSLSLVDYGLRRRFAFVAMEPLYGSAKFRAHLDTSGIPEAISNRIIRGMGELNHAIETDRTNLGPGFRIGHSFFTPTSPVPDPEAWYRHIVETEIHPLLEEYWFDSPETADQWRDRLMR